MRKITCPLVAIVGAGDLCWPSLSVWRGGQKKQAGNHPIKGLAGRKAGRVVGRQKNRPAVEVVREQEGW